MARLILTEAGEDVEVGGNVTVVGTTAPGEVITLLRGTIVLDPSFNAGGDTIRLPDFASAFTVRILGSTVILVSETVTVSIPIGPAGLQVAFDDVTRNLVFDSSVNAAKLGDQLITTSETGVLPLGATAQLLGTESADTINGTANDDVIDGLGGNDSINGLGGDDFVRGGLGDDILNGGAGDDQLIGGAGNDRIIDNEGGYAVIDGGTGNDSISLANLEITSFNIAGGAGNDIIDLTLGTTGVAFVSGGDGADRVIVSSSGMEVSLLLGAGRDEVVFPSGALGTGDFGLVIIRDFEVGANGDRIELASALANYLVNWTPGTNPFASGQLQLVDSFGNAYLRVDRDGPTGSGTFEDLINFAGVDRTALTADNLGGFDPRAATASAPLPAAAAEGPALTAQINDEIGNVGLGIGEQMDLLSWQGGYHFFA